MPVTTVELPNVDLQNLDQTTPEEFAFRRAAWAEAALNEKYSQAVYALKSGSSEDCFCITGLACEIYRQLTGHGKWIAQDEVFGGEIAFYLDHQAYSYVMPVKVAVFFGLKSIHGTYSYKKQELYGFVIEWTTLTKKNDDFTSFEEFAAMIENPPTDLFMD